MKDWHTVAELVGLPGLSTSPFRVLERAAVELWDYRPHRGRGGGREYAFESLPAETKAELVKRDQAAREQGLVELQQLPQYKVTRAMARSTVLNLLDERFKRADRSFETFEKSFVDDYNAGKITVDPAVRRFVRKVSPRTLRRWRARRQDGLPTGLVDRYGNRSGTGVIEQDEVLQGLILGALAKSPAVRPQQLLEFCRAKDPVRSAKLSKHKVGRFIARYKANNPALWLGFVNPDKAKSKFLPAFGRMSENVVRLNQVWELDSTPADVMLTDGRHNIIGCIDVYSRRMKLVVSRTSKASAIAALLRRCILDWGVPERVRTDNGQDYASKHIETALLALQVEQDFCAPFESQQKPHIERGFKTFSHDLLELVDGYLGHNVAEQQAIRARAPFAKRLGEQDVAINIKMTAEELQAFCDDWCKSRYERHPHEGLGGKSPFEIVAAWTMPVRSVENERALDILLDEAVERVIGKKGVKIDGSEYGAGELGSHEGKRVLVRRDMTDFGSIHVFLGTGQYLCAAVDPERKDVPRQEIAAKMTAAFKRTQREGRKEIREKQKLAGQEAIAAVILAADREHAARLTMLPKRVEAYSTDALDGAAEAIRAHDELAGRPVPERAPAAELPGLPKFTRPARRPESSIDHEQAQRDRDRYLELRPGEKAGTLTPDEREELDVLLRCSPFAAALKERLDDKDREAEEAGWKATELAARRAERQAQQG